MPYGIPNFAAALRETVARQRRTPREIDPADYEMEPTPVSDEYEQELSDVPRREDYKPNLMSKIAAGLVGGAEGMSRGAGAGVQAGQEVMNRGYVNALREHGARVGALKERAGLEGARGSRRLDLLKERRQAQRSEDELALQDEAGELAARAEERLGKKLGFDMEEAPRERESKEKVAGLEVGARRYAADAGVREAGIRAGSDKYTADKRFEGESLGFGKNRPGAEKVIPVSQQGEADRQAIEQVVRLNPKFMKFVDEIAGKEDSDYKGMRIIPGDKVPQEDTWMPFEADERDMTPEEKADYTAFIRAVEDAKKQMYGTMVDPYANRGFGGGPR